MEYAMFNRVLMVLRSRCRPILSPRLLPIMLACSLLPAGAREASAQNITNNTPDQSLRSNFEVNPSTLGLELGLTLGNCREVSLRLDNESRPSYDRLQRPGIQQLWADF